MDKRIVLGGFVLAVALVLVFVNIRGVSNELPGSSCATVSPDMRDECCERQNAGVPHAMCVGSWNYVQSLDECRWVCESTTQETINSFNECVEAGNPVMESYPRKCQTSDGRTFTEVVDEAVGGQRDDHGCLVPAGYSWDAEIGACTRDWELKDENVREAAKTAVEYVGYASGLTILEVDVLRCPGCYMVYMEEGKDRFTVSLEDWKVENKSLTPAECENMGGYVASAVGGGSCESGETRVGEVSGFISPSICCVDGLIDQADVVYCVADQRGQLACTMEYLPVCADNGRTYSNACMACSDSLVTYYSLGECPV